MQICSRCNTQVSDDYRICPNCEADLKELSQSAVALKRLQANPRVRAIRIAVAHDACPACQSVQGAYSKEDVPEIPVKGCSSPQGCRCQYEPILSEIYP